MIPKEVKDILTNTFTVRAAPNKNKTKFMELMDDGSLKVAISAPAEKSKANIMLVKYLSKELGIPTSKIEISAGKTAKTKRIRLDI
jgi:uncharacterized protein YggU (UPF0235/DUF167 family)